MATVMSLNSTAFAVGVLVGSLGGGAIAEIGTTQDAFLAAFIALVAGILFFVVRTRGGGTVLSETGLDEGRPEAAGGRLDA
jgi:predicted MFS family arabinose efflux permease